MMKKILCCSLLLGILLCFLPSAYAASIGDGESIHQVYVSSNGDDTNTGAQPEEAVATLSRAYEILLDKSGAVKSDPNGSAEIVIMDALASIAGDFNADLAYTHTGKVTITGAGYANAAIVFDGAVERKLQFGGPTEVNDLTLRVSGKKALHLYAGTDLTLGRGVHCEGSVRLTGGVVTGKVENTSMYVACDTLTHVFGSDGSVTGKVTLVVDHTNVTSQLSAALNNTKGADSPAEGELTLQGGAQVGDYLFVNGHGTVQKMVINLYDCKISTMRSGRGANTQALPELELNIYDSRALPAAYGDAFGDITSASIRLLGLEGSLSWTLPTADAILIDGNSDFTVTSQFPIVEDGVLTVEAGSTMTLDRSANTQVPPYMGEGIVKLSGNGGSLEHEALPEVYVSSTGSNDNAGTDSEHPVQTLEQAYMLIAASTTGDDSAKSTTIVIMDALAAIEKDFNATLAYTHTGKVTITGAGYANAAIVFDGAVERKLQFGGPTEVDDLTLTNSGKVLHLYAGTDLTLGRGVHCEGSVRLTGGVVAGKVENTRMYVACDTLTYVFGSDGSVTGKVTLEVDGTNVMSQLSAALNGKTAASPSEGELTLRGSANVGQYLFVNGHGTVQKMVINLYDCTIKEMRSGRGKTDTQALPELELNIHDSRAIPAAYGSTYGAITSAKIHLSGVGGSLNWTLPEANAILIDGNSDFTVTSMFPTVAAGVLTVEAGSTMTLDRIANSQIPPYTGGGTVKLSDDGGIVDRESLPVVYVSSAGSDENAGTGPDCPVRTLDAAYSLAATSATGNDPLASTTIVIMDAVELTDHFYAERDYAHQGTVIVTSSYGGVDYKAQGAKIKLNYSGSKNIALGGPTVFRHLKIARINAADASYVTTNIYTGPDFHVAEDVEFVGGEGANEITADKTYRFQLRAGNYFAPTAHAAVRMSSGTCYFLMAASNRQPTLGDVEITVDGTASPWYVTGGGEAGVKIGGTVTVNIRENASVDRIYVSSTYTDGHEKKLTVNLTGGIVAALYGGRSAGTYLEKLELNVSGRGVVPSSMSLTNTKGNGTIENFTLRVSGMEATLRPDWSNISKLVVDSGANLAISSRFEGTALEVSPNSTVFLSYPNTVLPAWTGVNGAADKGLVTLEELASSLGRLLLSVDFEDGAAGDKSGNGRDGVVHGGISYVTGVDGGKAAYFRNPSAGAAAQYIDFGVLSLGTENFTIQFWMKTNQGGNANSPANGGTPLDMSQLPDGARARVLLSNKDFSTPDNPGLSLVSAGYYMYFGSSLYARTSAVPYQIDGVKEPLDDRWHQVTITVDRNGMEHILVDGELISSVYIRSQASGSLDANTAAEHLILGADGLGRYGLDLVAIDNLEIYSGIMGINEAKARWYCAQTIQLTCELDARNVKAGSQYTQNAIDGIRAKAEAAKAQANRLLAGEALDVSECRTLYEGFRESYESFLMGQAPVVSFIQVADAHIESIDSPRYRTLRQALEWANELGIDAYLDSGDYTSNGAESEYEAFWSAYMAGKGSLDTYLALGNHEMRVLSGDQVAALHLPGLISVGAVPEGYDKFYYEGEVNGYHILVLSNYLRTYPNYDGALGMEAEQLQWVEEKLNAYCGQGKPVFVLIHTCVAEVLGMPKNLYSVTTIQPPALYDLFEAHPEVIVATGHIHHGLGDICGVFDTQSGYHVLDVPSFRHNNIGFGTKSTDTSGAHHTGYFVYVYEDRVQYRAVDFATKEWLTAYDQTIVFADEAGTSQKISGQVRISGQAKVGGTLSADLSGMIPADAAVTVRWSCNGAILGTDRTCTLAKEHVGKTIMLTVTGVGEYTGVLTAVSGVVTEDASAAQPEVPGTPWYPPVTSAKPEESTTPSQPTEPTTSTVPTGDTYATVDAELSGTTASVTLDKDSADKIIEEAVEKNSANVILTVDVPAESNETVVTIPTSTMKDLAGKTNADLTVKTPEADVTITNAGLSNLASGETEISTRLIDSTVEITVTKDGERVTRIPGGIQAKIPASNVTPGTVAILVDENGNETILKKTVAVNGAMDIALEGSAAVKILDNSRPFTDTQNHWAKDAIAFVSSRELFQGTGKDTFSADEPMSRAMLVTVLHRLEGIPAAAGGNAFVDVRSDSYYAAAVAWATENKIVTGDGTGFNPDGSVTREQLAAFLYRYARAAGVNVTASGNLYGFADGGSVSDWAGEAMRWAVGAGIITGSDGMLKPADPATRAEVATLLMRFCLTIAQ